MRGIARGTTASHPEITASHAEIGQCATALRPKMTRGTTPSHPEKREVGNAND